MNLNDLQNIKVEDIDFSAISDTLQSRKDITAKIGLVLLTLIVSFVLYNNKAGETRSLKLEYSAIKKKTLAIEKLKKKEEAISDYINSQPKALSDSEIVEKLSELALASGVQISNFSPARTESKDYYTSTSVRMGITANSYNEILKFIYRLETNESALKFDTCTVSMETSNRRSSGGSDKKQKFTAELGISSIILKPGDNAK